MFELVQTRWKLIIKLSEYVCDCWGQQNKCSSHSVTSVPSSSSVAHRSSFPEHTRGPDFVDPRLPRHLPPSQPLHKYIFYSLLLIYTSTQIHLLQPLEEHIFCLLPTLYKSTSSAKAHLPHPRICVLYVRKLWDPLRINSRCWSLTLRERTEVRWLERRWTFQSGERYIFFLPQIVENEFRRSFWLLGMLFSHFSHDLSRELVTKINYSGAIILPSVMRWPMEPLKTLKS